MKWHRARFRGLTTRVTVACMRKESDPTHTATGKNFLYIVHSISTVISSIKPIPTYIHAFNFQCKYVGYFSFLICDTSRVVHLSARRRDRSHCRWWTSASPSHYATQAPPKIDVFSQIFEYITRFVVQGQLLNAHMTGRRIKLRVLSKWLKTKWKKEKQSTRRPFQWLGERSLTVCNISCKGYN